MRTRMAAASLAAIVVGSVLLSGPSWVVGQKERAEAGGVSTATPYTWSAEFMSGNVVLTRSQAVSQATTFDTIAATRGMYRSYVADMKAANPDLLLLVYLNGTHAQKDQGSAYPEQWYLRDANGNKVRSGWGNYLMDPTNPGWAQDVIDRCASYLASSGYDGCFLDTMGTAPTDAGYESGLPINPSTGLAWTKADWIQATTNIAAQVDASLGGRPLYANGIATGAKYFAPDGGATSQLLNGGDGAMVELWVRAPYSAATFFKTETMWKKDVDMLVDAARTGKTMMCITKVWSSASQNQKDAIHRYAFATFLLGATPGLHQFNFRYDKAPVFDHPYWHAQIGEPLGDYAKLEGVYQRTYSNGVAVVNPGTQAVTFNLPAGVYTTLDGQVVSGAMTLAAHTGDVLVRS